MLDSRRQRCGRNADLGAPDAPTAPWQGRGLKLLKLTLLKLTLHRPLLLFSVALEAVPCNGSGSWEPRWRRL